MGQIMSDQDLTNLLERITELESQLAFQEQTITTLNDALVTQQQDLTNTQRRLASINNKLQGLEQHLSHGTEPTEHQPPPHY